MMKRVSMEKKDTERSKDKKAESNSSSFSKMLVAKPAMAPSPRGRSAPSAVPSSSSFSSVLTPSASSVSSLLSSDGPVRTIIGQQKANGSFPASSLVSALVSNLLTNL
jgi:hypothetical protein